MEPTSVLPSHSKRHLNLVWWIGGGVALLAVIVVIVLLLTGAFGSKKSAQTSHLSNVAANQLFYDTLKTAAGQQRAHLVTRRDSFESPADAASGAVSDYKITVAEFDAATQDYRSQYMSNITGWYVSRCLGGLKYDAADVYSAIPQSFNEARQEFKQAFPVQTGDSADNCKANSSRHYGDVTDGIIPLALTPQQTDGWLAALKQSKGMVVTDGGAATYNHQKLHKLLFETHLQYGGDSLWNIVNDGAGLKMRVKDPGETFSHDGPDAVHLDTRTEYSSQNLQGFYLVDEQTKLPVYSEYRTAGILGKGTDPRGAVVKHRYSYPAALSLTPTSDIEVLN